MFLFKYLRHVRIIRHHTIISTMLSHYHLVFMSSVVSHITLLLIIDSINTIVRLPVLYMFNSQYYILLIIHIYTVVSTQEFDDKMLNYNLYTISRSEERRVGKE